MCRLLLPRLHNLVQSITRHPSSPDAPIFTLYRCRCDRLLTMVLDRPAKPLECIVLMFSVN
jgi:hypothetical protein